ncbi:hypothetical protein ElyMa_005994900 [Elysia marginata]|uniref:Chitin-binding type-4 domain-containing protein n=1 Tax=Elysia marginata TaxID=1093978 RepID=A0AAV4GGT5_9GAST|nr:hypothetical protein ElyMa_005994900 [Elysia marginata]
MAHFEFKRIKINPLIYLASSLFALFLLVLKVKGHGRLLEPPSRGSLWRLGYSAPVNYEDNQLFCGGVKVQYSINGGKCGVCGDPWNGKREHEAGGRYANGVIVRKYKVGQVINATVELTANHRGFFEFRICPTDNPFKKVTHHCLRKFPLEVADTGLTRFAVPTRDSHAKITVPLRLPSDVTCRACLFQWKYTAGNSWGVSADGRQCVGCGNQEQFYGCADIAIGYSEDDEVALGKPAPRHPWHFQSEKKKEEWHYGVVKYIDDEKETTVGYKSVATSHVYRKQNLHICLPGGFQTWSFIFVSLLVHWTSP